MMIPQTKLNHKKFSIWITIYIIFAILIAIGIHHHHQHQLQLKQDNQQFVKYTTDLSQNRALYKKITMEYYQAKFKYQTALNTNQIPNKKTMRKLTNVMSEYQTEKIAFEYKIKRDLNHLHHLVQVLPEFKHKQQFNY